MTPYGAEITQRAQPTCQLSNGTWTQTYLLSLVLNMSPTAHEPWSLKDVLEYVEASRPLLSTAVAERPLRCLKRGLPRKGLNVESFSQQEYIAISYTWPGEQWVRLYDSNIPTEVWNGAVCSMSEHISKFMLHVFDELNSRIQTKSGQALAFWVDHSCIDQENYIEKKQQVAIMDRVYSGARLTAVMLEDVELTANDFDLLTSHDHEERNRYSTLVRRILSARWFGRAWCSQEFLLSRGTLFYVHQTGRPKDPLSFASDALDGWLNKARIYDATMPRMPVKRGTASLYQSVEGCMFVGSFAWAHGVVQGMACFEVFDKIALVLNLVRTPPSRRLIAFPSTEGQATTDANLNVAKTVNVLAIQNTDFSLLQTGHQEENPFLNLGGFGWAALPAPGDMIADSWRPHIYEVDKDPEATVTSAGLKLKGPSEYVVAQQDYTIRRSGSKVRITVNDRHEIIEADWLQPSIHSSFDSTKGPYDLQPSLARLRDILYAVEALNAIDLWPTFMPADGTWTLRGPDDGYRSCDEGSLRSRIYAEYIRPGTTQRTTATECAFLHRDNEAKFSQLTLSSGFRMIVGCNVPDMKGTEIFQPFVMRMKEFGAHGITCNALILWPAQTGGAEGVRRVKGHVRCFQRLPDDVKIQTFTLR